MTAEMVASDSIILDLLRKQEQMTVAELAEALGVTATAVRQRLVRLMGQQLIERTACREGRGRPSHHYSLSAKGRRTAGTNFGDLAVALWQEVRLIADPEIRRGLLQRLSHRLADHYGREVSGNTVSERMHSLAELMGDRQVPFSVEQEEGLPVLQALACPYPDLAELDRGVCAMERMFLSEVLGEEVRLERCRLDGDTCCTFELREQPAAGSPPTS
jgi:DeoR family transcriptional regulator, suf operon transcriptional repressor